MKTQNTNQISKVSFDATPVNPTKPKLWLKPTDQMDTWLDSLGFYRKHIARDASSLFRCASEKIFLTQVHHLTARKHCIQFALGNPEVFQRLSDVPIAEYIDRLYNQREWGNKLDMEIMSRIYDVDFYMYKEIRKPVEKVTANGFTSRIVLSLSFEHHFDSVHGKQYIMNAAICQSIFYEILYKCVFRLEEVDYAVSRMLHDKIARYNSEVNMEFFATGFQMRLEMRDNCRNVKDLLHYGITPFPYKVAKSLDPNIYRNVEYDTWNEQRKGVRHGFISWNNKELQVGSRCIINFKDENGMVERHGYIQRMSPDKGPVLVFVEELGEKLTVPFETLEVIPANVNRENKDCPLELSSIELSRNHQNIEAGNKNERVILKMREEVEASQSSELCNVHYVHSTPTSVPTTCYACMTTQNCLSERNSIKSTQVFSHSKVTDDNKITYDVMSNERSSAPIASLAVPYQVPMNPAMGQDAPLQQNVVSNMITSKPPNTGDFSDGPSLRVMYGHTVDPYYRYGYPNYPCYVLAPNYVFPTNTDHTVQQNTDISRLNYSPPSYPVSSEMYYAMPFSNISNKAEVPPYSAQIYPTPFVSKPSKNGNGSPDADPHYRSKDLVCAKDAVPLASSSSHSNATLNAYPVTYPPVYYHSYDYYSTYPEIQSYDNISSVYPAPHYVPVNYPDDLYPANGPMMYQSFLPSDSQ